MRKIKLYIAISLDGKIAKADGDVDWLEDIPNPDGDDFGYTDFIKSIDTTLMGNTTYQQVLGFDVPFPYTDYTNYVFSRDTSLSKDEHVTFVSENIPEFVKELKASKGGDIWLIGGGKINSLLLNHHLVDEMLVSVIPVVLGDGIPLFSKETDMQSLILEDTRSYSSGIVVLTYRLNNK